MGYVEANTMILIYKKRIYLHSRKATELRKKLFPQTQSMHLYADPLCLLQECSWTVCKLRVRASYSHKNLN